jgi:hypothetical protein
MQQTATWLHPRRYQGSIRQLLAIAQEDSKDATDSYLASPKKTPKMQQTATFHHPRRLQGCNRQLLGITQEDSKEATESYHQLRDISEDKTDEFPPTVAVPSPPL